jgi:hypothetical protein
MVVMRRVRSREDAMVADVTIFALILDLIRDDEVGGGSSDDGVCSGVWRYKYCVDTNAGIHIVQATPVRLSGRTAK